MDTATALSWVNQHQAHVVLHNRGGRDWVRITITVERYTIDVEEPDFLTAVATAQHQMNKMLELLIEAKIKTG